MMREKIEPLETVEERFGESSLQKNLAQSAVRSQRSTHQLIDPKYRVSGVNSALPHQYTRTAIPIRDTSNYPLPPHEFTKSRLRQHTEGLVPSKKPGQSRVEWIPYQRKIIDFKDEARVQKRAVPKMVQQYRQQIRYDQQPRQRTALDYYAVERVKKYIPYQKEQKQYVTVQKMVPYKKTIYVPRTRQVYHGPNPGNLPIYGQDFHSFGGLNTNHQIHELNLSPQPVNINNLNRNFSPQPPPRHFQNLMPNSSVQKNIVAGSTHQNLQNRQFYGQNQSLNSLTPFASSTNIMKKYSHHGHHIFSNDSYESYVPSFRY